MTRSTPRRVKTGLLHRHLVLGALVDAAADRGIFALVVLAHDDRSRCRRACGRPAASRRPGISRTGRRLTYCWKLAADRDQQAPERDVVGHAGIADRAEEDRVVAADLLEPVLRHHAAGARVVLAAPVELVPFELEAELRAPPPRARAMPSGTTSLPMPSPAITAILWLVISNSRELHSGSSWLETRVATALSFVEGNRVSLHKATYGTL